MSRPFYLTRHAIARALDMGVDGDEILNAVATPQSVRRAESGLELRTHGRITAVYDPGPRAVVTVMWRYAATRQSDVRRAEGYGRAAEDAQHTRHRARMKRRKVRQPKSWEGGRKNRRRDQPSPPSTYAEA